MGIADELWAKLFLNPLCSVKATYNSQGKGLWQKLTAASGTFRLSRVIQPLFANVRPDPNDENNIQEIELVALDGGRVYNGGELNYGLMVKTYPSGRINSFDVLAVTTSGGTDTNTSSVGHYKRIYGFTISYYTNATGVPTGGVLSLTLSSGSIFEWYPQHFAASQSFREIVMLPVPIDTPVEAGGGEATITLTNATNGGGSQSSGTFTAADFSVSL